MLMSSSSEEDLLRRGAPVPPGQDGRDRTERYKNIDEDQRLRCGGAWSHVCLAESAEQGETVALENEERFHQSMRKAERSAWTRKGLEEEHEVVEEYALGEDEPDELEHGADEDGAISTVDTDTGSPRQDARRSGLSEFPDTSSRSPEAEHGDHEKFWDSQGQKDAHMVRHGITRSQDAREGVEKNEDQQLLQHAIAEKAEGRADVSPRTVSGEEQQVVVNDQAGREAETVAGSVEQLSVGGNTTSEQLLSKSRSCVDEVMAIQDLQTACSIFRRTALILAMHPDQPTGCIVDFALAHGIPFAVVPCCVHATTFPKRRVRGVRVNSYELLIDWLAEKGNGLENPIKVETLTFGGRNKVVYWMGSNA
ncbi:unnamed protein product [Amoebophrya sp. A25]|nr:unnamed protein product [Amoebophrya sp. A25]|eukprot:GSA25T00002727001.1